MPKKFSTARGREFGDGLRAVVSSAGLSSRAAAELLDCDEAKLSGLLNGKGGFTEVELAVLLGICRAIAVERDHLLTLFPKTHVKGWWQQYGATAPIRIRTFVENLLAAKTLIGWQPHMVPDLLQTVAYRRAVIMASPNAPAGELQEREKAGLEVQHAVMHRDRQSTFFIHELALHLPVGGHDVHTEQIHHLLRMSVRSNITIRILPTAAGAHAGVRGPFTQLLFAKYEPLVYLLNENSALFIEEKAEVKGYDAIVRSLDHNSLDAEQSKAVITRLGEALSVSGCANDAHKLLLGRDLEVPLVPLDESAPVQGGSS